MSSSDLLWTAPAGHVVELAFERTGEAATLAAKDHEKRSELLTRLAQGERIQILLTAETYGQGGSIENANFTEFSSSALNALARAADGTSFQRDHSLATVDCGGFVKGASKVETRSDGARILMETVQLVKPWAVEAALDGSMRKFSISWRARSLDDVICSSCGGSVLKCTHWPGDRVETKGGESLRVTYLYKSAQWRERSWVINPAITQTKPKAWEALSEARRSRSLPETSKMEPFSKIAAVLSCEATEDVVLEAARKLAARVEALSAEAADLRTTVKEHEALTVKVATLESELADKRKADVKAEADSTVAELCKDARIRPGGAQEKLLRDFFHKNDLATARALAASYRENEQLAPVGGRQAAGDGQGQGQRDTVDLAAWFASLPEHIRQAAGSLADKPEKFIRASGEALRQAGIQVPELPELTR
jgi:hypothetical protein